MYNKFLVFGMALLMMAGASLFTNCGGGEATDTEQSSEEAPATEQSSEEMDGESEEAAVTYVCPMHPEETSEDLEAKCGICGMAMVVASEGETSDESESHEGHDHDNHEGHNH